MFTFNGIGTRLYGAEEPRPDGTRIATLFFCLIYVYRAAIDPSGQLRFPAVASRWRWPGRTRPRIAGDQCLYRDMVKDAGASRPSKITRATILGIPQIAGPYE